MTSANSAPPLQRRSYRDAPSPSTSIALSMLPPEPRRHAAPRKHSASSAAPMAAHLFSARPLMLVLMLVLVGLFAATFLMQYLPGLVHCSTTSTSEKLTALDQVTENSIDKRRPMAWAHLTNLIMVAGHAIYTGTTYDHTALHDEANWILEPFQKGQVPTFLRHIERGVALTANDPLALLLFSGGQTRDNAGPRSEGQTYWTIANSQRWYGMQNSGGVENRSFTEEYARDSYENLLFSICRFRQLTGRYPREITVVGFEFKRDRFISLHRRALRFPKQRFHYVGIDPPSPDGLRGGLSARERSTAHGPFASDPYGCNTRILYQKREQRNPYLRFHPYPQGCPHLHTIFNYCGGSIYRGPLPWDPRVLKKASSSSELSSSDTANSR